MKRLLAILFIAPALACSSLGAPTPSSIPTSVATLEPISTVPAPATPTVAAVEPVDDVLAFIREDGSVALALIRDDGGPAAPEFEIVAPPDWWYGLANGEAGDALIAPGRTPRFRP